MMSEKKRTIKKTAPSLSSSCINFWLSNLGLDNAFKQRNTKDKASVIIYSVNPINSTDVSQTLYHTPIKYAEKVVISSFCGEIEHVPNC